MQFKYYYHCVIASLDLWKSVFFYIQIYMKTFILTMYGRKEMERPDKKELIVSYEKSEWQLLQKTMENTIIKACAYVQKIIETGINKRLYKFHVICLSPGLYHCSILNAILIYNL